MTALIRESRRWPDAVALSEVSSSGTVTVTYRALMARVSSVAASLRSFGPVSEPLGVCVRHDAAGVVAMLAALSTGRTLVPLSPAASPEDRAALAGAARLQQVVCTASVAEEALIRPAHLPGAHVVGPKVRVAEPVVSSGAFLLQSEWLHPGDPEDVALLSAKSGRSGAVKLARLPGRVVADAAFWQAAHSVAGVGDVTPLVSPWTAVTALHELFSTLLGSGTLLLCPEDAPHGDTFAPRVALAGPARLFLPGRSLATFAGALLAVPGAAAQLREVFVHGPLAGPDALTLALLNASGAALHRQYVTAETSLVSSGPVDVTAWRLGAPCTLGEALPGVTWRHAPDGELFVRGPLAAGYLEGTPDRDAFVTFGPAFPRLSGRWFRTGDRVSSTPRGLVLTGCRQAEWQSRVPAARLHGVRAWRSDVRRGVPGSPRADREGERMKRDHTLLSGDWTGRAAPDGLALHDAYVRAGVLAGLLVQRRVTPRPQGGPGAVLVTGATGLLGLTVVSNLLAAGRPALLLVRGASHADARARVLALAEACGVPLTGAPLVVVAATLGVPRFGLPDWLFGWLDGTSPLKVTPPLWPDPAWPGGERPEGYLELAPDGHLHLSGVLHLANDARPLPYENLEAANVLGTLDLLNLALRRDVPLLYASCDGLERESARLAFDPDAAPVILPDHAGPFLSVWQAESLVRAAVERGLRCGVARLPWLLSGGTAGAWFRRHEVVSALLADAAESGEWPRAALSVHWMAAERAALEVIRVLSVLQGEGLTVPCTPGGRSREGGTDFLSALGALVRAGALPADLRIVPTAGWLADLADRRSPGRPASPWLPFLKDLWADAARAEEAGEDQPFLREA